MALTLKAARREVLARPGDVAARQVLADLLLERGDPQGEFINAQCEAASLPVGSPRRAWLEARAGELLAAHRAKWLEPLRLIPRDTVQFGGGLVEGWSCAAHHFIAVGTRVAKRTPLRRVTLTGTELRHLAHVVKMPAFLGLEEVTLEGLSAWPFQTLGEARFVRLRALRLGGQILSAPTGLEVFNQPTWAPSLERLGLTLPLSASAVRAFSPLRVGQLERLHLVQLPGEPPPDLRSAGRLTHLRAELLGGPTPAPGVLAALVRAIPTGLERLELRQWLIDEEGPEALASLPAGAALALDYVELADQSLERLRRRFEGRLEVGVRLRRPLLRRLADRLRRR